MTITCAQCSREFPSYEDCPAELCWHCQRDNLRESYPDLFPARSEDRDFSEGDGI